MIAHLYICNRSFRWNGTDQLPEFQMKMAQFQRMMERINCYSEENLLFLFVESFLKTQVLKDVTMVELLDYDKGVKMIGKDALVILYGMLKHFNPTNATIWDLKSYLSLEDENLCHAIIVFSPIKGLGDHMQVISTEQGWYNFRRHYLGKYPKNPRYFLDESMKYFPGLNLHPDNETTMRDVIHSHPMLIVQYLSVLNDFFADEFLASGKALNEYLPLFALTHKIEDASLEGSKNKKFYFDFQEGENAIKAYCEAHLKMYHDDRGNDNQHCRIYFKKPLKGEHYIYVGYIGEHL